MKNIFLLFIILIGVYSNLNAQVAIGTDTPAIGAALTIEDSTGTSGVLFPKVSIDDLSTVTPLPIGTEDGTIVYNTNTTTGVGYYFFKNNRWEPIFGTVGGMAKFTNAVSGASSNNLNNGSTTAQLFGANYFNDNAVIYQIINPSISANSIRIGAAGRYKIIINLSLVGYSNNSSERLLAVEAVLNINGTATGGIYRSSEMISPNSSSPDYGSIELTEIVNLNTNDVITVNVNRTQEIGNVYLRSSNTSSVFIERLD
ncbi:hypothetical protein [Nonlabens ulvanivorans]|uniref:hypothetical protein n=1 Tax=Nonlabens ulvanivorans TaxID=906888 RepID=UPI0029435FB1|nr:hypothetical protein [Nonlabens ulvanivorans]WOI23022.1 hypothetical protein R1T42_00970 [Nonlabens ulvanivorans]